MTFLESAGGAINLIKEQGEGTTSSPLDPQHEFATAVASRRFTTVTCCNDFEPATWNSDRQAVPLQRPPGAFDETAILPVIADPHQSSYPATSQAYRLNLNFNYTYTSLSKSLHLTFNGQPHRLDSAIALMQSLREQAMEMMSVGLGDGTNVWPDSSISLSIGSAGVDLATAMTLTQMSSTMSTVSAFKETGARERADEWASRLHTDPIAVVDVHRPDDIRMPSGCHSRSAS